MKDWKERFDATMNGAMRRFFRIFKHEEDEALLKMTETGYMKMKSTVAEEMVEGALMTIIAVKILTDRHPHLAEITVDSPETLYNAIT